jgi:hypothetical protein
MFKLFLRFFHLLSIKMDTKFVMWHFGKILQYFVKIMLKRNKILHPP